MQPLALGGSFSGERKKECCESECSPRRPVTEPRIQDQALELCGSCPASLQEPSARESHPGSRVRWQLQEHALDSQPAAALMHGRP